MDSPCGRSELRQAPDDSGYWVVSVPTPGVRSVRGRCPALLAWTYLAALSAGVAGGTRCRACRVSMARGSPYAQAERRKSSNTSMCSARRGSLAGFTEDHSSRWSRGITVHPRLLDGGLVHGVCFRVCRGICLGCRWLGVRRSRTRRCQGVAGLSNPYPPHSGVAVVGALTFQCGKNAAYPCGQHRVLSYHIPAAMRTVVVAAHELVHLFDQDLVRQGQPPLYHITLRHPPFRSVSLLVHRRLGPVKTTRVPSG